MGDTRAQIDILYDEVKEYRDINRFQDMLNSLKKIPSLAPFNAMLIQMQKPGSKMVLSAAQWLKRFGRTPKPGSRPLVILQTFGPVAFVYEYEDTEGQPIEDEILKKNFIEPFRAEQVFDELTFRKFTKKLSREGIRYREESYGTTMAGQIVKFEPDNTKVHTNTTRMAEHYIQYHACIVGNRNLSPTERFITVLHELGHFFCGHLGTFGLKNIPKEPTLNKAAQEFEAETVCWICCERLGIENPTTVDYLAGYTSENGQIPDVSVDTILKAAGCIENILHEDGTIRREVHIVKKFKKGTMI